MIYHLDDRERWEAVLGPVRAGGKAVVTTNGTFDLVHAGHLRLLREAKAQGDYLVVGLNSDRSVRAYKSPLRPIVPQDERAELVAALRWVDLVLIFDEPDCLRFVDSVRPDVHVKDSTYGMDLIEAPVVKKHGGRIHLVEKDGRSTTNIIAKVIQTYRGEEGFC